VLDIRNIGCPHFPLSHFPKNVKNQRVPLFLFDFNNKKD
jgi:hypothetical protein